MRISKILSYILHPIIMPIIVLYIGINYVGYFKAIFHQHTKFIYVIILLSTLVLPLISASIYVYGPSKVKSFSMKSKEERLGPLLSTLFIMTISFPIFNSIAKLSLYMSSIYISSALLILLSYIITRKWKISLHMLGIGGVSGTFIALNIIFGGLFNWIILFLFFSGLLAFARLDQKAHNVPQVYTGFLLGCLFQVFFILNYSSIISTISIFRSSMASLL